MSGRTGYIFDEGALHTAEKYVPRIIFIPLVVLFYVVVLFLNLLLPRAILLYFGLDLNS